MFAIGNRKFCQNVHNKFALINLKCIQIQSNCDKITQQNIKTCFLKIIKAQQ